MLPFEPNEALSPKERRLSDRKKLIIDVEFDGSNSTGIANTRDIGIGGLYIKTETELNTGDVISMKMTLGGEEFNVNGVIAYVDIGVGIGVRFKDLTVEQLTTLKNELEMD